ISFLAPHGTSFISSTTPLLLLSVRRSYFGKPVSAGGALFEIAVPVHPSNNPATRKNCLWAWWQGVAFFVLSNMAPPHDWPGTRCGERGALILRAAPETECAPVHGSG